MNEFNMKNNKQREKEWQALQEKITACKACPRLVEYIAGIRKKFPAYWNGPVPAFGGPEARILMLGLAPGRYGSNRTGRMFTGDASGDFMFPAMFKAGLCSQPDSTDADDGLRLLGVTITAAGRCAPPQNKPTTEELRTCSGWLRAEFDLLTDLRVVFALGKIGHDAYLRFLGEPLARYKFAHGAVHRIENKPILVDSYHPSRQNTNTGTLTEDMFLAALRTAKRLAGLS